MKKNIVLFLVLLSLFAKCQVSYRTLTFNTRVITELNKPLIAAIDRHIEVSKAKKNKNKNDFLILISVFPRISKWEIPKYVFDSIYANNDFKTEFPSDTVMPTYSISIVLASKTYYTEGWTGFNRKNTYFYNYKNYDVLISSELNLIFKNENEKKQIIQNLIIKQETKKYSPYKIWTIYSMWNNKYITEIRYKDLIHPSWTGKRDEFK